MKYAHREKIVDKSNHGIQVLHEGRGEDGPVKSSSKVVLSIAGWQSLTKAQSLQFVINDS